MTSWQLYWLVMLDRVNQIIMGFCMISGGVAWVSGLFWAMMVEGGRKARWWHKALVVQVVFICGILAIIAAVIPSTKEMAFIIVAPKMANAIQSNEKLTQMPDRVLDLANDWIEELKPKEKK